MYANHRSTYSLELLARLHQRRGINDRNKCCAALGIAAGPCNIVTLEDLKQRLSWLTRDVGLRSGLIVPGLIQYLIAVFDREVTELAKIGDGTTAKAIDEIESAVKELPNEFSELITDELLGCITAAASEVANKAAPEQIKYFCRVASASPEEFRSLSFGELFGRVGETES